MNGKSILAVGAILLSGTLYAQTPAAEDACDGLYGAAYGLCNAYCEAMDCDSVTAPQASANACVKVFDRFAQITGDVLPCEDEAVQLSLLFGFLNPAGSTVADANGLTFTFDGNTFTDPSMVYSQGLWGTYALYFPGTQATIILRVTNEGQQYVDLEIVYETYSINLDGSNASLLNGPTTTSAGLTGGQNIDLDASFVLPNQPKGLYRTIVKVYDSDSGELIATYEAIFCPPDADLFNLTEPTP